jgi:antitoxin VapB
MALSIRDPKTENAVRRLAALKGTGLTETIREAVERELSEIDRPATLLERLDLMTAEFAKLPKSGLKADKAFYDGLSGEDS